MMGPSIPASPGKWNLETNAQGKGNAWDLIRNSSSNIDVVYLVLIDSLEINPLGHDSADASPIDFSATVANTGDFLEELSALETGQLQRLFYVVSGTKLEGNSIQPSMPHTPMVVTQ